MAAPAKILVIEYDPGILILVQTLLKQAGYDVAAAATGTEGIRRAQAEKFDLVISEIELPGMNGFEVCRRLRQDPERQHTPVVFISGSWSDECQRRIHDLKAVDFISKPFDPDTFLPRILAHLKSRAGDAAVLPGGGGKLPLCEMPHARKALDETGCCG